jgi:DNA-binding CsgD family transcriptional regulator
MSPTELDAKVLDLFQPVREVIEETNVSGYSLLVNYSVRGYQHFESTYPQEWQDEYDSRHYHVLDPALMWSMFNEGTRRWSETGIPDTRRVMKKAAKHGLGYGAIWCRKTGDKKTALFAAKQKREFTDSEIHLINAEITQFFEAITPNKTLSDGEIVALDLYSKGASFKEVAAEIGVSESAIKERIASAKRKLDCRSTAQLIRLATEQKLLS